MEFFDSHAHLEASAFDPDREAVIARASSAGVVRILTCGADLLTSEAALALAQAHPTLYAAVGVHGHEARQAALPDPQRSDAWTLDETMFVQLVELAGQPKVVALGELGLDYHYNFSPPEVQRAVLARQLALACALDRPVILHNRESDADLRAMVEAAPGPLRGVLHCFLADQALAEWALARGFYIGVAGPITFKNARHLPEIVRHVPLDRLLIETDSPYLAPHPQRGRRNEPAFVVHIAEKLAEILDLSLDELARRTTENANRLLGIT